jgi:hypothetical protein
MKGPFIQRGDDGVVTIDGDGQELTVSTLKMGAETVVQQLFEQFPRGGCMKVTVRIEFEKS